MTNTNFYLNCALVHSFIKTETNMCVWFLLIGSVDSSIKIWEKIKCFFLAMILNFLLRSPKAMFRCSEPEVLRYWNSVADDRYLRRHQLWSNGHRCPLLVLHHVRKKISHFNVINDLVPVNVKYALLKLIVQGQTDERYFNTEILWHLLDHNCYLLHFYVRTPNGG